MEIEISIDRFDVDSFLVCAGEGTGRGRGRGEVFVYVIDIIKGLFLFVSGWMDGWMEKIRVLYCIVLYIGIRVYVY